MLFRAAAALVLAAAATLCACGDDGPAAAKPGPEQITPSAPAPVVLPVEPSYPDTAQGLESMVTALVKAVREDDAAETARLLLSLQLPAAESWFREVFGAELGPALVAEQEPQRSGIGWLASHIKDRLKSGQVAIRAERFDAPEQPGAVGYQSAALARMVQRVPLYSVRFATPDGKKTWHVWSFVHYQGTFRYVGKMRRVASGPLPAAGPDPLELRLSEAARVKADR